MAKVFVVFALCVALVVAVPTDRINSASKSFGAWKAEYGKVYESEAEHARRAEIFAANARLVEKHNSEGHSWFMALNQFADLTPNEFAALQTLAPSTIGTENSPANFRYVPSGNAASKVDWRDEGLVNEVKNQGQCGSCWAFSTVVSYEGQVAKNSSNLVSFSEQNLVDCVKNVNIDGQDCCDGCQGGLMDSAFRYMIDSQGGLDTTESSYPYEGKDNTCRFSSGKTTGALPVTSFTDIAAGDESALQDAVANVGPISVAVDANIFWQLYGGGVFSPLFCNGNALNHGVAVVGYDSSEGFWIIRNSWGGSWGEKGYMRMKQGKNLCGVANSACFPNL